MKWTQINESMIQDRESTFTEDISDLDASFAISEAISFAAEGKYIAEGLFRDILSFNKKAEDMNYSTMEYISEAFSIGGVFKKIVDFMVRVWKNITSFIKNLFKNKSSDVVAVNKAKKNIEVTMLESKKVLEDLGKTSKDNLLETSTSKSESKKETSTPEEKPRPKQNEQKLLGSNVKADASGVHGMGAKTVKTNRLELIAIQLDAFNDGVRGMLELQVPNIKRMYANTPTKDGTIYKVNEDTAADNIYATPNTILALSLNALAFGNTEHTASGSDLEQAMKVLDELIDNKMQMTNDNIYKFKEVNDRLSKFKSAGNVLRTNIQYYNKNTKSIQKFVGNNSNLFEGEDIKQILSNIYKYSESAIKDSRPTSNLLEWLTSLNALSMHGWHPKLINMFDGLEDRAQKIYDRILDMQIKISDLAEAKDIQDSAIKDLNVISSNLTKYQSMIQDMFLNMVIFIQKNAQNHLELVESEVNKLKKFVDTCKAK